ncbi:leader peptidase (prepilin peptidase)/N-methyltransferase [Actinoplanes lutulentus]|uniref:Leader peptidase (Prepilin peptidase)/N-methyltransferase n=1 Tax=Actinoplanes lutulentus TaxID=1287878 RepID=A0A327ZCC4_9ACTN|nr:A24 family peptidase [Actinoplanes lutulentus]MBB2941471.1 leader peptidase (prepilin peptidase)/N-methyltransferase [Actinoplanes lutulentus]RAK36961.1 leader peptidase (prepilin peptidase)/N-methyltransferase [Actinoplanes lutulentus]
MDRVQNAMLLAVTPGLRWLTARFAVEPGAPVRTRCGGCGTPLAGRLFSPSGRCGDCGVMIGAPPYLLELVTVTGAVLAVLAAPSVPIALAALWWVACAVPLLFIDLRVHRLPDPLTGAALAGVLLMEAVAAVTTGPPAALGRALLCALAYGALLLVPALILGPRGLGLGDVKLFVSIAALFGWWGWSTVFTVLFLAFLASGVVAAGLLVTRRARRGTHIAMGPYLVGAAFTMLALLA